MNNKHYIFVLGSYLPRASANGNCVHRLSEELISHGATITIIAQQNVYSSEADEHLFGCHIIRCTTQYNNIYNIASRHVTKGGVNFMIFNMVKIAMRIWKYMCILIKGSSVNEQWVASYVKALDSIKTGANTVIIPCCFPMEALLAAAKYKEKHNNAILMPWLIDLFAQSSTLHRTSWNKRLKYKRHVAMEKYVLEKSDKVLYFDPWETHLNQITEWPEKNIKIGLPLIVPREVATHVSSNSNSMIRFVYMGSLLKKERNPEIALQTLSKLSEIMDGMHVDIYHMGDCNDIVDKYARQRTGIIRNHGSVANSVAEKAMLESDVLILIGNNHPVQIPSKLYEYVSTGKAIMFFQKDASDPVLNVLRLYGKVFVIDESKSESIDYDSLCSFIERRNEKANEISNFYEENTPSFIANVIEKSIN